MGTNIALVLLSLFSMSCLLLVRSDNRSGLVDKDASRTIFSLMCMRRRLRIIIYLLGSIVIVVEMNGAEWARNTSIASETGQPASTA